MFPIPAESKHSIGQLCDPTRTQHVPDCFRICPIVMIAKHRKRRNISGERRQYIDERLQRRLWSNREAAPLEKISRDQQYIRFLSNDQISNALQAINGHPPTHVDVTDLSQAQA